MKHSKYPTPNGTPPNTGTAQCTSGRAVQPTQKNETTMNGPAMHASGSRRASSLRVHAALRARARARNASYQRYMEAAMRAPRPTLFS